MSLARPLFRSLFNRSLRLWDRFSLYVPLLSMGLLALGTYWLVHNAPMPSAPESVKSLRHESDYFMRQFTIRAFGDGGQMKSEIYGVEARHYPDTDTLEIDEPRIRSVSPEGRLVTSTSLRALSNGDGSEVQLIGNARVVREAAQSTEGLLVPRMEFRGEFLHTFVNEERVKSHKPVVLSRGGDQFTGDTLAYSNLTGIAELNGRVKGLLVPRVSRQTPQWDAKAGDVLPNK